MLVITVDKNKIKECLFILCLIYPEIFLLECSCVYVGAYERFKSYIPSGQLGLQENCRMVTCGLENSHELWTASNSGERSGITFVS